jgi:hypothetical protein
MTHTTIGELINTLYENFLHEYGDPELASIATAAVISDMLTAPQTQLFEEAA